MTPPRPVTRGALRLLPWLVLGVMLVFVYLPVLVLVVFSFHDGRVPVPPFAGPTLRWYAQVLSDNRLTAALLNSLVVGIVSSGIAVSLALLAAWGIARGGLRGERAIEALLVLPLGVSTLVVGVGLMVWFAALGLSKSMVLVTIGHVVLNLPLAYAIVRTQFDPEQARLEDAARDLGASEAQVFARITVPSVRVGVIAAFVLCFTFSWDEFIVAFLLGGFDPTLPVQIWSLLRTGLDPRTNAAGTIVFLVSIALLVIVEVAYLRKDSRERAV